MPGFDRAFFLAHASKVWSDKPLARADRTSGVLEAKAAITTTEQRLAKNIATFDNLSGPVANLTRGTPHATTPVAPALYRLVLFNALLVFPHDAVPIETLNWENTICYPHDSTGQCACHLLIPCLAKTTCGKSHL
ncbi:hypothetical protein [Ruegeria halocynthiae]|uniref:hypothetical protein n=1 Tax=Ruegeria halocynthiae TaxID=985054 RepID=UPI00056A2ADE|nr:hypothetical protein [Ruegeria halocynthiae]